MANKIGSFHMYMKHFKVTEFSLCSLQVRVCAFPASRLGLEDIGISPDCNPENRATPREVTYYL